MIYGSEIEIVVQNILGGNPAACRPKQPPGENQNIGPSTALGQPKLRILFHYHNFERDNFT